MKVFVTIFILVSIIFVSVAIGRQIMEHYSSDVWKMDSVKLTLDTCTNDPKKDLMTNGRVCAGNNGACLTGNVLQTTGNVQNGRMHFIVKERLYVVPQKGTHFNNFAGGDPKIHMTSGGGKHAQIKLDSASFIGDFGAGNGNLHLSGNGILHLLFNKGVSIGPYWGGTPTLNIRSGAGKKAKFCIDGTCIEKQHLEKLLRI